MESVDEGLAQSQPQPRDEVTRKYSHDDPNLLEYLIKDNSVLLITSALIGIARRDFQAGVAAFAYGGVIEYFVTKAYNQLRAKIVRNK